MDNKTLTLRELIPYVYCDVYVYTWEKGSIENNVLYTGDVKYIPQNILTMEVETIFPYACSGLHIHVKRR